MSYERSVTVDLPFEQAVERVRDVLADQGFGVLTEIDVQETLRIKRGIEMELSAALAALPQIDHCAPQ